MEKYERPTLGGSCLQGNWTLLAALSARMRGAMKSAPRSASYKRHRWSFCQILGMVLGACSARM
eukprot:12127417-Alexandrium_andersonii.AAC.1